MAETRPGLKFIIFAIVCSIGAAWLVMVTGNYRLFPSTENYFAEMSDVTGLAPGDDVRVAGVRAGRVNSISLERGVAVVEFNLDDDIAIRDTWESGLRWRNVIGQRYLYLYPIGDGERLEPGDRLPAVNSRPVADVGEFFNRITPLLQAIDPEQQNIVMEALNEALVGREERVQELITSLGSLTGTLAEREPEIRSLIANANDLLAEFAAREAELTQFFDDFADVSDTLAARNDELIGAVVDIADVQDEFAGMLERNDAEIRALLDDLDSITDVVAVNRDEIEQALTTTPMGFATYMMISRRGQWFDVRGVAAQVQASDGTLLVCEAERGSCDESNPPEGNPDRGPDSHQTSSRNDGLSHVVNGSMASGPTAFQAAMAGEDAR
jgi:phospholipid/cholesterol/gamma-HCH transport system substrate-binding protein